MVYGFHDNDNCTIVILWFPIWSYHTVSLISQYGLLLPVDYDFRCFYINDWCFMTFKFIIITKFLLLTYKLVMILEWNVDTGLWLHNDRLMRSNVLHESEIKLLALLYQKDGSSHNNCLWYQIFLWQFQILTWKLVSMTMKSLWLVAMYCIFVLQ